MLPSERKHECAMNVYSMPMACPKNLHSGGGINSRADRGSDADCFQTGYLVVVGGDRRRMMGVEV